MKVAVLIPYRPEDAEREANFARTLPQWRYPAYLGSGPDDGVFSRAVAINAAARRAPADTDVFVIADSDLLLGSSLQVDAAVAVAHGQGIYVVAYTSLAAFDWPETRAVRLGARPDGLPTMEWHDRLWGGVCAVPASLFREAGGFDAGFIGWGYEDGAFLAACAALSGGQERVPGVVYHLRHTDAPRVSESVTANQELAIRYREAKGRDAMLALIEERRQ